MKKILVVFFLCFFVESFYAQHYYYRFQVETVNDAKAAKFLIESLQIVFNEKENPRHFKLLYNDERHEFFILSDVFVSRQELERTLQADAYTLGQFDVEEND